MLGITNSGISLSQSAQETLGSDYKARVLDTQLSTSEINTLKCKLQVQFTSKISAEKSLKQLSDDDYDDILTQLHSSLEPHYTAALNNAGFGRICKSYSPAPESEARSRIETLKTFLGINGRHLMKMNLSKADLREEKLQGMLFSFTDLSMADLSEADLSRAILRWTNLSGTNLNRAILSEVTLCGADLRAANLDFTIITLQLPETWKPDLLDAQLNHLINGRSLLTAINSIDDCYKDLKINLMHQIVDSLKAKNTDTSSVNKALLAVWEKDPIYTEDKKISSFIKEKCSSLREV